MGKRIVAVLLPVVAVCAVVFRAHTAFAHHDPLSSLTITIEGRAVRLVLVVPADELALWHPPAPSATPEKYAASAARKLQQDAADLFELRLNYNVVGPSNVRAAADNPQVLRLEVEYPPPDDEPVRSLQVFSNLVSKLSPGHQQVTCVQDARPIGSGTATSARVVAWVTLTRDKFTSFVELPEAGPPATTPPTAPAPLSANAAHAGQSVSFFQLGVEHILTGYDHLLFLTAILLVCASFREAATIITCFTVAHSITLALAALDLVRLPSRVIEPVIAASIVYVALENLIRFREGETQAKRRLTWRAAVTFAFGLVHGLGFASVLRDLGLGSSSGGVVLPLLKFNLGVETGQLAVAAVVFPLILVARSRGPLMERRLVPACSVLIALAGAWWLFERVALA